MGLLGVAVEFSVRFNIVLDFEKISLILADNFGRN